MLGFPSGSILKNPPVSAGDGVQTPGQEYTLENEITTYSSILAWEIPWTRRVRWAMVYRISKELDKTEQQNNNYQEACRLFD